MTAITASASLSSISASASFANQTVTGGITPSGILYRRPILTGSSTSYVNYDDGWGLANNVYDYTRPTNPATVAELDHDAADPFITLKQNNAFGNKNRFTDDAGGQTYSNSYAIDHLTGLGWYLVDKTGVDWSTGIANAQASTDASLSGWRVPNQYELTSIILIGIGANSSYNRIFGYPPFSNQSNRLYFNSTSHATAPTTFTYSVSALNPQFIATAKSTTSWYYYQCRNHYT